MTSKTIANGILRALGILLGICLIVVFLYKIQSIIIYIIVAGVISLVGRPVVLFFRNKLKFPNILAVVITMLLFMLLFACLFYMFIPLIENQGKSLELFDSDKFSENIIDTYMAFEAYMEFNHIDIRKYINPAEILSRINFSMIPSFFNILLNGLGSLSIGLFSVLFITFFFLKESQLFEKGMTTFIPQNKEMKFKESFKKIKDLLSRYFVGLFFQIIILFIIYSFFLLVFGIKNSLIIAFLCALLNLVPYLGPLFSAVLLFFLTLTSGLSDDLDFNAIILPKTLYVLIGFVIAQLIDNFFSQPIIFSKSVKSHPLEIFLIIITSGALFGVLGMIVAIPSYTAIKVVLKVFLSNSNIVRKLTRNI